MGAGPSSGEPWHELGRLPAGIHGLSRDQVAESQRERLLGAVAEIVVERGYDAATIAEIAKVAGVSSRDFYAHFDSAEACFLAAFEVVVAHLHRLVDEAAAPDLPWPRRVVAALAAALDFFAANPDLARLGLIEPLTATPPIALRFREALLEFAPLLAAGREHASLARPLPASTEESLLGGVLTTVAGALVDGRGASLHALLPDLVEFVLSPYLGAEQARELAGSVAR